MEQKVTLGDDIVSSSCRGHSSQRGYQDHKLKEEKKTEGQHWKKLPAAWKQHFSAIHYGHFWLMHSSHTNNNSKGMPAFMHTTALNDCGRETLNKFPGCCYVSAHETPPATTARRADEWRGKRACFPSHSSHISSTFRCFRFALPHNKR